jgi:NIMA (never in mitosis gene a)-related kinase
MSLKSFEILNKVGEGAYSEVHKVRRKSDGMIYALKKVKFGSLTEKERENSVNEIRILASIAHPNVITFKEAFIDEGSNQLCLITEFADGGDLLQKISLIKKRRTHFAEAEIWDIFVQTLKGLKALHDLSILHRDIKCANVYLNQNGCIKIGDMNVSKVAKMGLLYTQTGTPYYASPEVWKDKPYDSKSDIWSLGCVIYEVAALCPPFQAMDMKGLYRKVISGDYPTIPNMYSEDLSRIIRLMLKVDPRNRPSCEELLINPIVLKHCETSEPLAQNELLNTIKIPKQINALTKSLPASNYNSQKISHKYPEAFHSPPKSVTEPIERIDRLNRIDRRNEKCKKKLDNPPYIAYHNPFKQDTVAKQVQALKEQYDKLPASLPPIRPVYNRVNVKPSWWG